MKYKTLTKNKKYIYSNKNFEALITYIKLYNNNALRFQFKIDKIIRGKIIIPTGFMVLTNSAIQNNIFEYHPFAVLNTTI